MSAKDNHIEVVLGVPTPVLHEFEGALSSALSPDVLIEHKEAVVLGSVAENIPPHIPKSGAFQRPPTNRGVVAGGASTVLVNHKPLARDGDPVETCNDPKDLPIGAISAASTVLVAD